MRFGVITYTHIASAAISYGFKLCVLNLCPSLILFSSPRTKLSVIINLVPSFCDLSLDRVCTCDCLQMGSMVNLQPLAISVVFWGCLDVGLKVVSLIWVDRPAGEGLETFDFKS